MTEKKTAKLKEIYESRKAKRAIYSQCHIANCLNPEITWIFNISPCQC